MYKVIYNLFGVWHVSENMSYERAKKYKQSKAGAFPVCYIVQVIE